MLEHGISRIFILIPKCCGHTCAVKQRAAKINACGPMGKFYSALLGAVKQRLVKPSCSNVIKVTMFPKGIDVQVKVNVKSLA